MDNMVIMILKYLNYFFDDRGFWCRMNEVMGFNFLFWFYFVLGLVGFIVSCFINRWKK